MELKCHKFFSYSKMHKLSKIYMLYIYIYVLYIFIYIRKQKFSYYEQDNSRFPAVRAPRTEESGRGALSAKERPWESNLRPPPSPSPLSL